VAFVKADLDSELYTAPPTISKTTFLTGNTYQYQTLKLPTRKIYDPEKCEQVDTVTVVARKYEPVATAGPTINLQTIDLDSLWDSNFSKNFQGGIYALITLPERAVPNQNSRFRDGMNMQVNTGNIYHYLQKDVVRGMPGLQNQTPGEPYATAINQIHDLDDDPAGSYGLAFRRSHQQAVRKALQGLTFDLTNRISIISPSPVVPDLVAIPLESQERNYGPWTSVFEAYGQIGGKMDYIHDENLTPWTCGSYSLMDKAGKLKSEFGTSAKLMSEKGSFSYPFWPSGLTLGAALISGGPLTSDISTSVDANGVSTSVVMNTYTQSFGKLQKQREDQLKKLNRQKQKIDDLNNNLVRRNIGKGQDNASFKAAINDIKHLVTSQDFSNRNYSALEKDSGSQTSDYLNISHMSFPTEAEEQMTEDTLNKDHRSTSSVQSQAGQNYMHSILSENIVQAAQTYANTATERISNLYSAVAHGFHQSMSSAPPQSPIDPNAYGDSYADIEVSTYQPEK